MEKIIEISVDLTPEELAFQLWNMYDDEQAEFIASLLEFAGSEYTLQMQFMHVRDKCEKRKDGALGAFQAMFSSAFKYFG